MKNASVLLIKYRFFLQIIFNAITIDNNFEGFYNISLRKLLLV